MATEIIYQQCFVDDFIPASRLRIVEAATTEESLVAVLYCINSAGAEEQVYWATLLAVNGRVELLGFDALLLDVMYARGVATAGFRLRMGEAEQRFNALYCDMSLSERWDAGLSFLTPALVRRVHCDSVLSVSSAYIDGLKPWAIRVQGISARTGCITVLSTERYSVPAQDENWVEFRVWDILEWAMGLTDDPPAETLKTVSAISVERGSMQQLFYLSQSDAYLTFRFRNSFNCPEYIDVVGKMESKLDVSRSEAVCGGVRTQYDREVSREFTVESEAFPYEEIELVSQFLASGKVQLVLPDGYYDVVIHDISWSPSTDGSSLSSAKFTWSFADQRRISLESNFMGIMPQRRNIFTYQFSPAYE